MIKLNNLIRRSSLKGLDYRKSFIIKVLHLSMYNLEIVDDILDAHKTQQTYESQTREDVSFPQSHIPNKHIRFKINYKTGKIETILLKPSKL